MLTRILSTTALVVAMTLPAYAQTKLDPSGAQQPAAEENQAKPSNEAADETVTETEAVEAEAGGEFLTVQESSHVRGEDIIGKAVVTADGDEVATVSDVLLDQDGRMVALILTEGGVLGIGGKKVAVRMTGDTAATAKAESISLDVTEEQLAAAPAFKTQDEVEADQETRLQMEKMKTAPSAVTGGTTPMPTATE